MKKIGILSSHNGSGYTILDKACQDGLLDAKVSVVISNNSDANVLKNATKNKTPNFVVNQKLFPNENLDKKITDLLLEYDCDYIFLSGYMKKLESNLISNFENKIINSHPALLPKFGGKGMYGRFVHEAVIEAKETTSGVTIHFVNEEYDEGEYILQKSLEVKQDCSVEKLESAIKKLEATAIVEAFEKLLEKKED